MKINNKSLDKSKEKKSFDIYKLNDAQIENIKNHNYINLIFYNKRTKTKTTYVYKSYSKNYIFYICNKRKKCNGKGQIKLNTFEFIVNEECDENVEYCSLTYEEYSNYIDKKEYGNIYFNQHKYKNIIFIIIL